MEPADLTPRTLPQRPEGAGAPVASTTDLGRLTRQELQLAKVELKEEARQAGRAAGMAGAAAVAAVVGLTILAMAGAWLLDDWMPRSIAFLVIAGVLLAVAALLALQAKNAVTTITPYHNKPWKP